MQWTDGPDAGFTAGDPWLPVNPNSDEVNVESARADPDSVWHYFRDLVDLRQDHDVLVYGEYADRLPAHDRVWAYERTLGADRAVVVLNVDDEPVGVDLERVGVSARASPLLGNCPRSDAASTLRPYEARVYLD
jgi:glycosidase